MNRVLIIANVLLLVVAVAMFWLMSSEQETSRRLARQLAEATGGRPGALAAVAATNDLHEACQAQVAQMADSLSNVTWQLNAAQDRVHELEARVKPATEPPPVVLTVPATPPAAGSPAAMAEALTNRPPPAGSVYFDELRDREGKLLDQDVEFSGVYGRRVAFKVRNSTRRVAFDVDQLGPSVLAKLGINAEAQKALQARQDRAWQQVEAAGLAMAAAEEQRRHERRAAEEAARAEEERKRQAQAEAVAESSKPPVEQPVLVPYPWAPYRWPPSLAPLPSRWR